MKPIIIFHHCYLFNGEPPELKPWAMAVVEEQMLSLQKSGLADAASEIICGINGGEESINVARLIMPPKAKLVPHGLQCKNENRTIILMEEWCKTYPDEAYILYFHAKGSSHDPASDYGKFDARWRNCLMYYCIDNWQRCVADLESNEAVGAHWLTGQGSDHSQHYFAGTFHWVRASFFRTIPSMFNRARIKMSGIDAPESKYEAEVHLGNGPRCPAVKDYATHPLMACP